LGQTEKYVILEQERNEVCGPLKPSFENLMAVDGELEHLYMDCRKDVYAIMKPEIVEII
jgi:hypothetical protein